MVMKTSVEFGEQLIGFIQNAIATNDDPIEADTDLLLTDAARAAFADAGDRYGGDVGELHVAKRLEDDTGLSFRMDGDWTPPWEVTDG